MNIYDAQHGKMALMPHANSEGPDERAHPCSLIWLFFFRRHILQYPLILEADNVGPDQPVRMRRFIMACVVRKLHKCPFRALRINYVQSCLPPGLPHVHYIHTFHVMRKSAFEHE